MIEDKMEAEASRITVEPGKRSGQPCIRGLRITVEDVRGWLAAGMDQDTILADYPELEPDDFSAIVDYAQQISPQASI